ncbi:family 43 glycosylhydrolase [Clostridium swellfunianum]|uniref:family 43 glycosylhydrolase n=1 Tax=Clostridium swellfunianum TaxID=1367462 RepID=UPI00202E3D2E|nr:family 43 glycosylhydrolase [Clostridium swellfunianum]MCM0646859.1 family 43 glycosylhydrolase [Clostridium swellfunianum]
MISKLENGAVWYDTNGNIIHAHGGHMLFKDGFYYWYGENRTKDNYVSCYRSKDLMNWEFRNNILTTDSKTEAIRIRTDLRLLNELGGKVNLERPKVLYNELTQKYVLWVHYENGIDYSCAACAIATSDSPDGDFVYHGSFNPYGYMSRDCTLYKDEDGTAYFISASRDNADLHVYKLTEDYMNVESLVHKLWQGEYREAPALVKKGQVYYMISSFCTGWEPNQCKYAFANSIDGRWSLLKNIGDETTYCTQPAFILPIEGDEQITYIYVSDRWDGENYHNSRYVFLPIDFNKDGSISINYCHEFEININDGKFIAKDK